jgi:hypothetical protein
MRDPNIRFIVFDPRIHFVGAERFNHKGTQTRAFRSTINRVLTSAAFVAKTHQRQQVVGYMVGSV